MDMLWCMRHKANMSHCVKTAGPIQLIFHDFSQTTQATLPAFIPAVSSTVCHVYAALFTV